MWSELQALWDHPDFWKYACIPFISAIVGWGTNVLALQMTFQPIEFVGIGKLGWQGIIPSRAPEMAGKAVDIMTRKLITMEERFEQIDALQLAEELEPSMYRLSVAIVDEVVAEQAPLVWDGTPTWVKQQIYVRISEELPDIMEELLEDIKLNINQLFDLRGMVVEALKSDKALLNEIFLRVGDAEFAFIKRSGFYFGGVFGIAQMVAVWGANEWGWWGASAGEWILPLAGLFVGWATNFLALKMIFLPIHAYRFGPWRIQGLFLKRQMEVSESYAKIVAHRILTAEAIFQQLLSGPASDRLMTLIQRHIKRAIDHTAGISKSWVLLVRGADEYRHIKDRISERFLEELPGAVQLMLDYTSEVMDIEGTLRSRMQVLGPRSFVGFLRPVFQADEWKLILVGAVLGFAAGMAQWVWMFGQGVSG
ncbi:hypothetical protein [Pontibacter sp. G13]|uniref:DUF445 domain-containing protein n=1 Tax=Pontibacter sp. G13 TaxID=3074898 RepID=UPI002889A9DA|nr:hypothetical protein [Pontibacter sp. G13]WNJ16667.1 hypothetical protein RJD25_17515 [Pontibacter sp. G13]